MASSGWAPLKPIFTEDHITKPEPEEISPFPWKFGEGEFLTEMSAYLEKTYGEHYAVGSNNRIQSVEYIQDVCQNTGFLQGNAIKYLSRVGKKDGFNRKDLMKAVHYIILLDYYSQLGNEN